MEHIAILSIKRKLLGKILSGEKTIESRWYKTKKTPFNSIKENDIIFFKETGMPITAKAIVEQALFFDNLDEEKIKEILNEHGKNIGVDMSYFEEVKDKKLCSLIFI